MKKIVKSKSKTSKSSSKVTLKPKSKKKGNHKVIDARILSAIICLFVIASVTSFLYISNPFSVFDYEHISVSNNNNPAAAQTSVVKVTSISMSSSGITLNVGASQSVYATINPKGATNTDVTWTSSDSSVLSVSTTRQTGMGVPASGAVPSSIVATVKGLKAGTVILTATAKDGSGVKKSIGVTVKDVKASSMSMSGNGTASLSSLTIKVGASLGVLVTINPGNVTNTNVTWTSSNTSVLSLSTTRQTGMGVPASGAAPSPVVATIRGVKAGTSTLTAASTDGSGVKRSITVTVK